MGTVIVTETEAETIPGPRLAGQPLIVMVMAGSKPELPQTILAAVTPPVLVRVNVCIPELP